MTPSHEVLKKVKELFDKHSGHTKRFLESQTPTDLQAEIASLIHSHAQEERKMVVEECARLFSDRKFFGPFTDDGMAIALRSLLKEKPNDHEKR